MKKYDDLNKRATKSLSIKKFSLTLPAVIMISKNL